MNKGYPQEHFTEDGQEVIPAESVLAWHFLASDGKTAHEGIKVRRGVELVWPYETRMCVSGYHASQRLLDAMFYATGPVLTRVACRNIVDEQLDKIVCRNRLCLAIKDVTWDLWAIAYDLADAVLVHWQGGKSPEWEAGMHSRRLMLAQHRILKVPAFTMAEAYLAYYLNHTSAALSVSFMSRTRKGQFGYGDPGQAKIEALNAELETRLLTALGREEVK